MAGELVPLILVPRYLTYAGAGDFTTIAMDVTEYENAIVNVWRGKLLGIVPSFLLTFEESTDQFNWTSCSVTGGTHPVDPGENQEAQRIAALKKRWFRTKLTLGGSNVVVSCWAVGSLEQRTD
jgi:hypothetical protein